MRSAWILSFAAGALLVSPVLAQTASQITPPTFRPNPFRSDDVIVIYEPLLQAPAGHPYGAPQAAGRELRPTPDRSPRPRAKRPRPERQP